MSEYRITIQNNPDGTRTINVRYPASSSDAPAWIFGGDMIEGETPGQFLMRMESYGRCIK